MLYNNKGNTSKTWKTIRKIVPNCKSNNNDCNFDSDVDKANEFNVHFSNVGKNTYEKTQEILPGENVTCFSDENVILGDDSSFRPNPGNTETIILTIKSLNETSSVGSDGIPMKFIKDSLYVIVFYLTCIINISIVTGLYSRSQQYNMESVHDCKANNYSI